jgi:predicted transcriptional regulator
MTPETFSCSDKASIDWEHLARAQAGPLRVSILEILTLDGGRTLSPSEMTLELQVKLSGLNYHVRVLERMGLLTLVAERKVRGADEHFYCLSCQRSKAHPI